MTDQVPATTTPNNGGISPYVAVQAPNEFDALVALSRGQNDLDRIKVPAGGGRAWEIPTQDGLAHSPTVTGVVLKVLSGRSYWPNPAGDGGAPPVCSSDDGERGRGSRWDGDPHTWHDCAKCKLSAWGSGAKGVGSACREKMVLLLLRAESLLPLLLNVPVTSQKAVRQFFYRSMGARLFPHAMEVELGILVDKSANGTAYSTITIKMSRRLSPEEAKTMKTLAERAGALVQRRLVMEESHPMEGSAEPAPWDGSEEKK